MAKEIDLESQEQIEALKQFWDKYGTLITTVLVLVSVAFFGFDYYKKHQYKQAVQASVLYGQMQLAADAKEIDKVERIFADMQKRYGGATYTLQAGFLAAKSLAAADKNDEAQAALQWVLDNTKQQEYQSTAKLRMSSVAVAKDDLDKALEWVSGNYPASYQALAQDRKGDVLLLQGKNDDAVAAYQAAYKAMDTKLDYRKLIEAKLTSLGAAPADEEKAAKKDRAAS